MMTFPSHVEKYASHVPGKPPTSVAASTDLHRGCPVPGLDEQFEVKNHHAMNGKIHDFDGQF